MLGAAYFLKPFGISGVRWLFIHLAVLALALIFLRSRMEESERWEESKAERSGEGTGINWGVSVAWASRRWHRRISGRWHGC